MGYFETEIEAIRNIEDRQEKYARFYSLLFIFIDGQHADVVVQLLKDFIQESEADEDYSNLSAFYGSLSYISLSLGKKDLFLEYLQKARAHSAALTNPNANSIYLINESIGYWFEGKRNDGFDHIFKSIKVVEGTPHHEFSGWSYFSLATFQFDSNQLDEAEINYNKALDFFKKVDAKYGYARASNGIASIKIKRDQLLEAAEILNEIRSIYTYYGKLSGLSRALTDLGVIESKLGHYDEALKLYEFAYQMRIESSNVQGQITSLIEIGNVLLLMKNYSEAEAKLNDAALISERNGFKAKAFRANELLAQLHKEQGNFEKAMMHLEKYFNYKTQVLADESTGRLKVLETQLLAEEADKRAEIEMQGNIELRKAYNIIEVKNTEILQSIDYARRIQKTILPANSLLKKYFKDLFILYKPKDIVAGDFYWMHQKGKKIFFAVCDCTGHGVPGAFVSLVCYQALNRAVVEFNLEHPAAVLDKVNEIVIEAFSANEHEQVNDGMDASVLMIDFEAKQMEWAGANNPILILDKSGASPKLIEIKGNKQPIGRFDFAQPFTNHQFPLVPGSYYYLFSDGFSDQFGGPDWKSGGKKYSQKRFRELILSLANLEMKEQEAHFEMSFTEWKAGAEQIDDVLLAGIAI